MNAQKWELLISGIESLSSLSDNHPLAQNAINAVLSEVLKPLAKGQEISTRVACSIMKDVREVPGRHRSNSLDTITGFAYNATRAAIFSERYKKTSTPGFLAEHKDALRRSIAYAIYGAELSGVNFCDTNWENDLLSETPEEFGPQEPPQDPRIFNRRQPDGSFRPLSEFFKVS